MQKKRDWSAIWSRIFFLVGVVGMVAMIASTDFSHVDVKGIVLERLPLWLPLLMALWGAIYLIQAVAYGVIMQAKKHRVPLRTLLRVTVSGFALNHVTPAGLVGGEFYRVLEMKPFLGTERAVSTALTFTVMNTFAHVMFWATGAAAYLLSGSPGEAGVTAAVAVMGAVCTLGLLLFLRNCKRGLVLTVLRWLARWPLIGRWVSGLIARRQAQFTAIDADMEAFYARRGAFLSTTLLEYAARLLEAVEFYIIFLVMGLDVPLHYCVVALSVASLVGNLFFIIPMQVGTRELGLSLALSWVQLASPLSLTAAILSRIREIVWTGIGTGMLLIHSGGIPQPPEDKEA